MIVQAWRAVNNTYQTTKLLSFMEMVNGKWFAVLNVEIWKGQKYYLLSIRRVLCLLRVCACVEAYCTAEIVQPRLSVFLLLTGVLVLLKFD